MEGDCVANGDAQKRFELLQSERGGILGEYAIKGAVVLPVEEDGEEVDLVADRGNGGSFGEVGGGGLCSEEEDWKERGC